MRIPRKLAKRKRVGTKGFRNTVLTSDMQELNTDVGVKVGQSSRAGSIGK